jgi:broad specificity phosphatase PhoE
LARQCAASTVWTSPERRASETAALAFPSLALGVREQLIEVTKPWYPSADDHAGAVARYLRGEAIEGWERREDVATRMGQLQRDAGSFECLVVVSHGLLLTTWLEHEIGLDDPFSFWSNLRMPDAWELSPEERSLTRLV